MNINLAHRRDSIRHKSGWVRNLPDRTFLCLFKSLSVLEDVLFCRCCCCTKAVHARATPTHRGAAEILAGYSFSRFPRDKKQLLTSALCLNCVRKGRVCSRFLVISLCSTQRWLLWGGHTQLAWLFGEAAQHVQYTCFLLHGADMNGLCQGFVTSDLRVLETVKELRLYPEVGGTGALKYVKPG